MSQSQSDFRISTLGMDPNSPRTWLTAVGSLVLVAVALKMTADGVGVDGLRAMVTEAGWWGPLLYMALRASTYVIAPLSIPGIEAVSGLLFGMWWGTLISVGGQTLGGAVNFWIARLLGRAVVERLAGRRGIARIEEMYGRVHGWRGLLFARLILPGYDFLSYAAGLTRLPFDQYLLITAAGGLPGTFLAVALGSSLADQPLAYIGASLGLGLLYGLALSITHWWQQRSVARKAAAPALSVREA